MVHWPWYIGLLSWLLWGSGPLSPLCQNFQCWFCDQWCYSGQIWGMGLLMFLEPFSKCSGEFPYIFLITLHPVTIVPVDDSTLFHKRIFVLGSHQEAFDGITSFEIYWHSILLACSLEAFTQPFIIWHHYVRILFLVAGHAALAFLLFLMGWCFHSYFKLFFSVEYGDTNHQIFWRWTSISHIIHLCLKMINQPGNADIWKNRLNYFGRIMGESVMVLHPIPIRREISLFLHIKLLQNCKPQLKKFWIWHWVVLLNLTGRTDRIHVILFVSCEFVSVNRFLSPKWNRQNRNRCQLQYGMKISLVTTYSLKVNYVFFVCWFYTCIVCTFVAIIW